MSDIPMKYYWMGEDVEMLSREMLLQAVKQLSRELESTRSMCRTIIDMERKLLEHSESVRVS